MIAGDSPDSSSLIRTVFHSRDTQSICQISSQTSSSLSKDSPHSLVPSPHSDYGENMNVQEASEMLTSFVKQQSGRIQNLERDMRRISSRFGAREKALLHQITSLRDQLQLRTAEFQEKISEFHSALTYQSGEENTIYTEPSYQSDTEEEAQMVTVEVGRSARGLFGFKLICGNSAEPDCDRGIYVAGVDMDSSKDSESLAGQLLPYDRIMKVNGQDISGATEGEALCALTEAREPIVVEVLRRMNPWRVSSASSHVTIATQTDPISSEDEDDNGVTCPLLALNRHNGLMSPADMGDMNRLELAVEGYIDDTDLEDPCTDHLDNLEYEEVTLKRSRSSERIGLTLCYGNGENEETDIFVSEVESRSLADKNGRIWAGDQILQINGVDVHTRNQAIELFQRNKQTVTLLLARSPQVEPLVSVDDLSTAEETLTRLPTCLSPMPEQVTAEEEDPGALTDATRDSAGSAHEKDSGISRTTDSEPELLPPPIRSPSAESSGTCHSPEVRGLNFSGREASSATMTAEGSPTEATCGTKTSPTTPFAGTSSAMSSPGSEAPPHPGSLRLTRSDSEGSLERELSSLHREMETIRLECDRLIAQHDTAESRVRDQMQQAQSLMLTVDNMTRQQQIRQSRKEAALTETPNPLLQQAYGRLKPVSLSPPPSRSRLVLASTESPLSTPGNRRPVVSQQQLLQQKLGHCTGTREDTSSAYNTGGESCRSTPQNMDYLGQTELLLMDQATGKRDSALYTLPPPPKHRPPTVPNGKAPITVPPVPLRNRREKSGKSSHSPSPAESVGTSVFRPGDVMYTNPDNLHDTIVMQQRMLREAMILQAQNLKKGRGPVSSGSLQNAMNPDEQSEWKIKRRSDGSRYIAKRPVRNKILKEREQQLTSERCGISTDDDAMSELKIGRYWTREEKKLHLEKSKERKRRQEELIRRKNHSLQKNSDQAILQLSHKKMMRKKGHQLFDNFTTIQEFLAHGNRSADNAGALGILSVTTV